MAVVSIRNWLQGLGLPWNVCELRRGHSHTGICFLLRCSCSMSKEVGLKGI